MSNFTYLSEHDEYKMFAPACIEAEKVWHTNPAMCAIGCRKALELAVKWVYAADQNLQLPYSDNLQALIHETSFRYAVSPRTWAKLPYIIKLGNLCVHTNQTITATDAKESLVYLFEFIDWLVYSYGKSYAPRQFDASLLPTGEVKLDIKKIKAQETLIALKDAEIEKYKKEIEASREELTKLKDKRQETRAFEPMEISEWETRKRYIDVDLKLLGWDFEHFVVEEFEINDMMNIPGQKGFIDYVLFGKDGIPLALIEAKKTCKDPNVGKQQAKLYADSLERKYGRRPIIFNTNGFETFFWDDTVSPQRPVFSVFSQADLQKLINRRTAVKKLNQIKINKKITERYYQEEAIRAVCDNITNKHRRSLLVMATGTGKTRTAVSIVDVLTRGDYATNVLFLADRTALVKQAKEAFKDFLPNMSLCNLLSNKDDKNARIVFSTYPTMLNSIDTAKTQDGQVLFTPAHFDLIIVDEAHRSIFKKYKTIFDYFDALIIGLTATPKTEVDRNTYDFFEMEQNVPTYAYDYETAVKTDHVLVPFYNIEVKTKFLDQGIKYNELSEKERERYEDDFWDEDGDKPEEIPPEQLNKFIFNQNTVDLVLQDLMQNGVKIDNGNLIGKTIIFAQNKKHAQYIVKRFDTLYPQYKGLCAKRIVCDDAYSQTLIDEFKDPTNPLQIAVSVDMMDTGIDVPEVVNLVFFKKVRSKTKFWQMIGRGTRLCKNLLCTDGQNGTYLGKKYFYIFDYLGNFDFFRTNKNGIEGNETISLFESIFSRKTKIAYYLQSAQYQEKEYQEIRESIIESISKQINTLNSKLVAVRQQKQYIDKYKDIKKIQALSEDDRDNLVEHIAPLVFSSEKDTCALQFDNFMYGLMLEKFSETKKKVVYQRRFVKTAQALLEKSTIPQIKEKLDYIKSISEYEYVKASGILELEIARQNLRELIKFLVDKSNNTIITNLIDIETSRRLGEEIEIDDPYENYRDKVNQYILQNSDYLVIYKLTHNKRLTESEFAMLESILMKELGTKADYEKEFGKTPLGILVRKIAKLDHEATMEAFSDFINDQSLNQQQIVFVKKIINHISINGYMAPEELVSSPFDKPKPFIKLFNKSLQMELVNRIKEVNNNAVLACA